MGSAMASAELADEALNGQRTPTATPAIWWPPHSHHAGRHFMKVISFSFADSQLTRNSSYAKPCLILSFSRTRARMDELGGREGKNMSPSWEAQTPA